MKKLFIYNILLLCLCSISCESFLDINPKQEVVNKDMFESAQGCEDAVMGLYGNLKRDELYGRDISWNITEVLAQNLDASTIDVDNLYQYLSRYNYNDAKSLLLSMWTRAYEIIGHANNIIINIEAKPENTFTLQNLYVGESYGVRALLHFDMLRLFAPHVELYGDEDGIPYVTTYSYEETPFYSVKECYEMLISDLKKAQTLLEADKEYMTYPRVDVTTIRENFLMGRETHMNYYAATTLLARVYWTMGDMANAKTEALKVIDSDKFPLEDKDQVGGMIAGVLSTKESIFGIYSTYNFDIAMEYLAYNKAGSFGPFTSGSGASGDSYQTYVDIYNKDFSANAGVDNRYTGWFGSLSESASEGDLMCHKILDFVRADQDYQTPAYRGLIEGISVLRVAELYHIVAEAYLDEGNRTMAAQYLNEILLSRGLTKLEDRSPAIEISHDVIVFVISYPISL